MAPWQQNQRGRGAKSAHHLPRGGAAARMLRVDLPPSDGASASPRSSSPDAPRSGREGESGVLGEGAGVADGGSSLVPLVRGRSSTRTRDRSAVRLGTLATGSRAESTPVCHARAQAPAKVPTTPAGVRISQETLNFDACQLPNAVETNLVAGR